MKLLRISSVKNYLLIPGLLWDGTSELPSAGYAVLIRGGVIRRVAPASSVCSDSIQDTEVVHLPDLTLMPGLVDCHVHFSMDGENLFRAIEDWEKRHRTVMKKASRAAVDYLANGIVAVRDGGDKMNIGLAVRNSINSGSITGPQVTATGQALYRKGMYGAFLGPGAGTVEEALTQIEVFHAQGIDQLKVVVSGLVSFREFGVVGPVQFSGTELRIIVEKARDLGLKVMAHASSAEAVENAVLAGVDSVEHGYFLSSRQLEMMAERGTAWIPTLAPLANLVYQNHLPYEGADMDVIRRTLEIQMSRIREAYDMGIRLGVGTDAGANQVPHGRSYLDELNYYSLTGLSNSTVLRIATAESAGIIGRDHELGTLLPGKKPFLLGVHGNPLESLDKLTNPELVILPESFRQSQLTI